MSPAPRGETITSERVDDFAAWYGRTRPDVVRSLLVVCAGDAHLAAEAADEAMVRAYERWARVRAMERPEGWVLRVAINVVRRRFRRRATEDRAVDRLGAGRRAVVPGVDPSDAVTLWAAVATLDRRTREIVALRYVAGLTEDEVAGVLGMRVGTVSARLSRARATLRSELGEDA